MSTYDKASLVLIPSGTKEGVVFSQKPTNGDGDFTFTRASSATRVNSDGLIEKETQNLLLQSNSFDTTWGNIRSTETSGQSGYDGTNDAWLLESTATAQSARVYQSITKSYVHTMSVYAKAGTSNWAALLTDGNQQAYFDLANGLVGSTSGVDVIDSNIEAVGATGWYRCSATFNGNDTFSIFIANGDGNLTTNSGDNIYIQDAQLNQGLVADSYLETTTTAVYGGITDNIPRLDYTDASCPSLKLEPQRTNLVDYSEYFEASEWNRNNITLTANHSTSPEGFSNAYLMEGDSNFNVHRLYDIISVTNGVTYTFSVFVKAGTNDFIQLYAGTGFDGAGNVYANFDLSDGTKGNAGSNVISYDIEDYGSGWYRCYFTATSVSSLGQSFLINLITSKTAPRAETSSLLGQNVEIYGAQLEESSYPTSYIPTYGASVTRVAEASMALTNVDYLVGQTEGTIYIESYYNGIPSADCRVQLSDGTSSNNWIFLGHPEPTGGGAKPRAYINNAGVNQVNKYGTFASVGFHKYALAYKENDVVLYFDGDLDVTDTLATIPTCNQITITGASPSNTTQLQETKITKVMLFKTRLSNEELADLTTI